MTRLFLLLMLMVTPGLVPAQSSMSNVGNTQMFHGVGIPSGACLINQLYTNDSNGDLYNCHLGVWNKVSGGGGGGTPGAPPGSIQYNNSGTFGGTPSSFDGTNTTITSLDNSGVSGGTGGTTTVSAGNGNPGNGFGGNLIYIAGDGDTPGSHIFKTGSGTTLLTLNGSQVTFGTSVVAPSFSNTDSTFSSASGALSAGLMGINSGSLGFIGVTDGNTATIGAADTAGSPSRINIPTTTGASGQVLQTDGGTPQQTSWVNQASGFSAITGGTNTTAAMVVGTGASLGPSGTGTITATNLAAGTKPGFIYSNDAVAQVSAITDTVMVTPGSNLVYRFSATINCTTTSAAAVAALNLKYTDTGSVAQTISIQDTCTSLVATGVPQEVIALRVKSGVAITWGVTITNTPTYDVSVRLEPL